MFTPTIEAGLPTVLLLRKTWDAMLSRVDGKLLCVVDVPHLTGVTLVYEKDESPMLAFFVPGVPEPSDLQEYALETHMRADTLYEAANYLRNEYGHWILRDGLSKDELVRSLELYATLISLSKGT
jgi:hypothetical protein